MGKDRLGFNITTELEAENTTLRTEVRKLHERIARLEAALTDDEVVEASKNDWETKRLSKGGFLRVISTRSSAGD